MCILNTRPDITWNTGSAGRWETVSQVGEFYLGTKVASQVVTTVVNKIPVIALEPSASGATCRVMLSDDAAIGQ